MIQYRLIFKDLLQICNEAILIYSVLSYLELNIITI